MKKDRAERYELMGMFILIFFVALATQSVVSATLAYILVEYGAIYVVAGIEIETFLLLIALISLPIGLLISFLFSKVMLKPVRDLINGMDQLASGNFASRVQINSALCRFPTFIKATESFNKMAEELEGTEMLRSDFVNNFSHEVKTPIVSIAGFAKLLKRNSIDENDKKEYLNVIEEESIRLAEMATNVLNMTKVENQSILTGLSCYNLSEQIRSCILLLESQWGDKNIGFDLNFDEYQIYANEELLKQVWINLLDNAIKFSEENQNVGVKICKTGKKVYVSVTNSGKKISEDNMKRIFQKFYQADKSHGSRGNGLGLSIVKRIVELHNGKIMVESSDAETVFTVELPSEQK